MFWLKANFTTDIPQNGHSLLLHYEYTTTETMFIVDHDELINSKVIIHVCH